MKNTASAIRAITAIPPTTPPTIAPIGADEEEGVGAGLVVVTIRPVVVGELVCEFWLVVVVGLEVCGEVVDAFSCENGIPVVPEVGRLEVRVTVTGEKTRPSFSWL